MKKFKNALKKKLLQSQLNNYGNENYDYSRFGELSKLNIEPLPTIITKIKIIIQIFSNSKKDPLIKIYKDFLNQYEAGLQIIYALLNKNDKELMIEIIAYRLLGYKKIKLRRNNNEYWNSTKIANSLFDMTDSYDPHFMHFILYKCDLRKTGKEIQLFTRSSSVATQFLIEQYAYKLGQKTIVEVENEDVVLDIGACWGDTALYFASKAGKLGKVFSFEFIPNNIKLFNINISLNPKLLEQIDLIENPVSDQTGSVIYFIDRGPASKINLEPFDGHTGFSTTITIDDFVKNKGITKVDFIKMDIEGAEPYALIGAIETIKKFKPKLAIAIYHSMDDFINIPNWISELRLGYKLYLGHYTIHSEETIIFAKIQDE